MNAKNIIEFINDYQNGNGITLVTNKRNSAMYLQGKESEGMICQIRYTEDYPSPVYNLD